MIKWKPVHNGIIVENLEHFDPVHTFECGQCFRWSRREDGHWFGIAGGLALNLEWDGSNLIFHNTSEKNFINVWYPYFDFGRDYGAIKKKLSENDPVMAEAIKFGYGIRLLKQDFHEIMISFLISQNNGIPRIRKIIESMAASFGERLDYPAADCYAFPTLKRIAGLAPEDLKVIRAGYRDKYIYKASQQIISGEIDLNTILTDVSGARNEMLKLSGVGEKVADCTLLFSGIIYDIFPVDRWVKRVMAELYLGYEASYEEISGFASEHYGELAGFAQQYLFYYAREKRIGMNKTP